MEDMKSSSVVGSTTTSATTPTVSSRTSSSSEVSSCSKNNLYNDVTTVDGDIRTRTEEEDGSHHEESGRGISTSSQQQQDGATTSTTTTGRGITTHVVYLIRHAETVENVRMASMFRAAKTMRSFRPPQTRDVVSTGRFLGYCVSGQTDAQLSDRGNQQIAEMRNIMERGGDGDDVNDANGNVECDNGDDESGGLRDNGGEEGVEAITANTHTSSSSSSPPSKFLTRHNISIVAHSPLTRARLTCQGLLGCSSVEPAATTTTDGADDAPPVPAPDVASSSAQPPSSSSAAAAPSDVVVEGGQGKQSSSSEAGGTYAANEEQGNMSSAPPNNDEADNVGGGGIHRVISLDCLREATPWENTFGGKGEFRRRQLDFEDWLASQNPRGENIAVVGHSQYFKEMLGLKEKFRNCDVWRLHFSYCPDCRCRHDERVPLRRGSMSGRRRSSTLGSSNNGELRGDSRNNDGVTSVDFLGRCKNEEGRCPSPQWSDMTLIHRLSQSENHDWVVSGSQ